MKNISKAGNIPVNARITIDYSKKKPIIKFEYPRKDAFKQNLNNPLIMILALLILLAGLILFVSLTLTKGDNIIAPHNCNLTNGYGNGSYNLSGVEHKLSWINNFTLSCDNGINQTFKWISGKAPTPIGEVYSNFDDIAKFDSFDVDTSLKMIPIIVLFYAYIIFGYILLNRILTWIFIRTKWFKKAVPYINDKLSFMRGYYVKFNNTKGKKVLEIPMFNNIKMDYRATKDFSKQLSRFEIREHPFSRVVRKAGKTKKKVKNIYLWYARFYFKEVPKTGCLEVWFK